MTNLRLLPLVPFVILILFVHAAPSPPDDDPDREPAVSAPPVIPPSGRCFFPEDCEKAGEYCQGAPASNFQRLGACKARLGQGEDCGNAAQGCEEGLYCSGDGLVCKKRGGLGDACNDGNESCQDSLVCPPPGTCQTSGQEGDACTFDTCAKEKLYCKEDGGTGGGTCAPLVAIGDSCSVFGCCIQEAYQNNNNVCTKRLGEGEECSTGDQVCEQGLTCNGDELEQNGFRGRCVKESELIREGGAACDIAMDKCDDRRFMICRKRGDESICIFEIPAGACNPGADFETCLPNPGEQACLEIVEGGKGTSEYNCQPSGGTVPTKTPSPDPTSSPSPKPASGEEKCKRDRDCKHKKMCNGGMCIQRKCTRRLKRRCHLGCKSCKENTGRCTGGCRRRQLCIFGKCVGLSPFHRK